MRKILISTVAALSISSLSAYELKPVGFKATGMGGAGVASSRGGMATYYNPALIGFSDNTAQFSLDLGVSVRENTLLDAVDELNNLELTNSLDKIGEITSTDLVEGSEEKQAFDKVEEAIEVLNKIPQANGLEVVPKVSLTAQISKYFAMGAYMSSEIRAHMNIDKSKLNLIFDTEAGYVSYNDGSLSSSTKESYEELSIQYAIQGSDKDSEDGDESTYLNLRAISLTEIPLSFANTYEQINGTLSVGISAKAMMAETFSKRFSIDTESEDLSDDYEENSKRYSTVGVDLGIAYKEKETGLILGLIGKNINSPSFKTEPDSNGNIEEFKYDPFFRAGMSLPVWNDNIELAIDADLQESDTSYEGMKSRYVGGGIEYHPSSWFALRAGAMKNVAAESIDEGLIYTAGIGFGLKWFQFDLSAQASSESGRYDGEEIPKYMALNFSLVSKWGDGYNKKQPETDDEVDPLDMQKTIDENKKKQIQEDSKKAHEELDKSI